jgi:hypothetical protein
MYDQQDISSSHQKFHNITIYTINYRHWWFSAILHLAQWPVRGDQVQRVLATLQRMLESVCRGLSTLEVSNMIWCSTLRVWMLADSTAVLQSYAYPYVANSVARASETASRWRQIPDRLWSLSWWSSMQRDLIAGGGPQPEQLQCEESTKLRSAVAHST